MFALYEITGTGHKRIHSTDRFATIDEAVATFGKSVHMVEADPENNAADLITIHGAIFAIEPVR